MKLRLAFHSVLLTLLFVLCPVALAANTWYVDGVNGSDNNNCKTPQTACKTIGHAISLASSGDSIMVAPATYTENLTISISLKVIGAGASTTIIDGGRNGTVVTIQGSQVTLSKLTIRNGSAASGGGIVNRGGLTINDSIVSGNSALGGSIFFPCGGGGIDNKGGLVINDSTISSNRATFGGGICNQGGLLLNRSTLNGNSTSMANGCSSHGGGGGIGYAGGLITINNSTITGNRATGGVDFTCEERAYGGGIWGSPTISNSTLNDNVVNGAFVGYGGGIFGSATLENSIVANSSPQNCYGTMTSDGYNLSSDGSCNFSGRGDLNNTDAALGTLGNYGGPTETIPLLSGSPAIDAGNPKGCTDGKGHLLKTDQRGKPRPDKEDTGGCDMGAYERQKD